jgi:tRNA uridine 5-carboxymethylaminomethyl modification enzyme
MVDDLVTRGTREPYRMFTSRAEYRLLLREDNADFRLMEKGYELGIISGDVLKEMRGRKGQLAAELERLTRVRLKSTEEVNSYLCGKRSAPFGGSVPLVQLLKRPELAYADLEALGEGASYLPAPVKRQVEIHCKYEGYLQRQEAEARKLKDLERVRIPEGFDYQPVPGLSHEARQRLMEIRPASLGQASRIPGITPAAVSILMVYLKRYREGNLRPAGAATTSAP